jgi:hypothetical protein
MDSVHPMWAAFNISQLCSTCNICHNKYKFYELCNECNNKAITHIIQTVEPHHDSIDTLEELARCPNIITYCNLTLDPTVFYDTDVF